MSERYQVGDVVQVPMVVDSVFTGGDLPGCQDEYVLAVKNLETKCFGISAERLHGLVGEPIAEWERMFLDEVVRLRADNAALRGAVKYLSWLASREDS